MQWIRRGRQLGQAVRNAGRFREILGVFARHGFTDVMTRMNLDRFVPSRLLSRFEDDIDRPTEVRLRVAFEQLGPTFVKLGQLLATRPDLIPEPFVEELKKLQDNVRSLPVSEIRAQIERELGKPIADLFRSFDDAPLAAASIAQVHAATLHTGEDVVIKVQRPGIAKVINQDVALLEFLSKLLEKYVPETRIIGPTVVVDEFFRTLKQELDFNVEANNITRLTENLKTFTDIRIPKVYKTHSNARVLTLERFRGTPMNDLVGLRARKDIDLKKLNQVGARAFFKTVMIDGIFHGDLHGGNLFALNDGKLGLIDFGIVGRLSQKSRQRLSNMVLALMTEDFEALCYEYAELGSAGATVDFEGFQREVQNVLSPYLGLKANEVNSGQVLIEATKIASKYQIRVPGDWMIVFKALFTVEGLGRALDPHFDPMELGRELAQDLVKEQYSPDRMAKEGLWILKDFLALAQVLPRQIRWMLRKLNQNGYAIELKVPEVDRLTDQVEANGRKTSLSILSAGAMIAGSIALQAHDYHNVWGYPLVAVVLFFFAVWTWWRA